MIVAYPRSLGTREPQELAQGVHEQVRRKAIVALANQAASSVDNHVRKGEQSRLRVLGAETALDGVGESDVEHRLGDDRRRGSGHAIGI
jgi:hypothetical protein